MQTLVKTSEPPYYAVIFTSTRTDGDNGYGDAAKQMLALASKQPGFLGFETALVFLQRQQDRSRVAGSGFYPCRSTDV